MLIAVLQESVQAELRTWAVFFTKSLRFEPLDWPQALESAVYALGATAEQAEEREVEKLMEDI